jgi:hypothetical protein
MSAEHYDNRNPFSIPYEPGNNRVIIGISGKKGTGKSTIAKFIEDTYNFEEFAFANTLKGACMLIFNLSTQQLYGTLADKETIDEYWGVSPRTIMQELGTAIRNIEATHPTLNQVWIRSLHRNIEAMKSKKVVISDIRYQDEADSIKAYEAKGWTVVIVEVVRPATYSHVDTHESEVQEVKCDYTIQNNGTRMDLFNSVKQIMRKVGEYS